ncbi:DUF3857 domain-containing protein [Saprospiraceae bacterium]|nr:DUF3857 domain-containing protein [Saprospiraceae bacterium]
MKNIHYLLLIILLPSILFSQKFGNFDRQKLSQEYSEIDSTADYEIILKKSGVSYDRTNTGGYDLLIENFVRIKVYSEEGISAANFLVPFDPKESIYFTKAISYNNEGGKIIEKDLQKSNIYIDKVSDYYHELKFAVPNVKKGTIIDVMYCKRSPYSYALPKFYFQEDVPIIHAEMQMDVPSYFGLSPIATGSIELQQKTGVAENFTGGGERRIIYFVDNVPPMRDDEFVLNINDYRSSIKFEIESTKFPNSATKYYTSDWEQITKSLLERRSFGHQLTARIKTLNPFVESLKGKSEEEIIIACYEHLIEDYKWNEFIRVRSENGVAKVAKEKVGNSGDLNLLLINLLNKCGVKAYPYLTRVRSYGMLNTYYPSATNLNYMFTCVEKADGSLVFLDATNKELPIGQLPLRATNITGFVVKDGKPIQYDLQNPNSYISRSAITFEFDENNEHLIGTGNKLVQNYAAKRFIQQYEKNKDESYQQELEELDFIEESEEEADELEDITYISNIKGLKSRAKEITYDLKEYNTEAVTKLDDKIFLASTLGFGLENNPFTEENRDFPIFYNYSVKLASAITLKIPEGYKVESLPEDLSLVVPSRNVVFRHSFTQLSDSDLIVTLQFQVKQPIIPAEEYLEFKELFDKFVQRSAEKIVLTKI